MNRPRGPGQPPPPPPGAVPVPGPPPNPWTTDARSPVGGRSAANPHPYPRPPRPPAPPQPPKPPAHPPSTAPAPDDPAPVRKSESDFPHSRLAWRDLLAQALAGMLQRPARSMLTALGTLLGVGTFVAVLGLTATATGQIDGRFNKFTATEVTIEDTGGADARFVPMALPADGDARVRALNGVTAAGTYWDVRLPPDRGVAGKPLADDRATLRNTPVVAASAGLLEAVGATYEQGRNWDGFHDERAEMVAVIGRDVANRLGVYTLETQPAIFIGDVPFTVIGIMSDVARKPDLLTSVLVPGKAAQKLWGPPQSGSRASMFVTTELGAARQVAEEAPFALRPDHPDYLKSIPPPDPRALRGKVTSDLDTLFLLLAGICLLIGTVGIANTTLVAVMERTTEIGLRRALGARSRHIAAQFIAESGALGLLGGLIGTSLGTAVVVATAAAREWSPVMDPTLALAAPLLGLATGLVAGLYPSWRAAAIEPVDALRR